MARIAHAADVEACKAKVAVVRAARNEDAEPGGA
jgi:hypothetical protein